MPTMLGALKKCRHIPSWERPFLSALSHGYSEKVAANKSGVGMDTVNRRKEKDDLFRKEYEKTLATRKAQPPGGY